MATKKAAEKSNVSKDELLKYYRDMLFSFPKPQGVA